MNLSSILDDCLSRLAAGESVADCLASHPQYAGELAPMLRAATQLHVLSEARLTNGQQLRAKVQLREVLAARRAAPRRAALAWMRLIPTAALLAMLVFGSVAFSAVASSQPGEWTYAVRIAAERVPVWIQPSQFGRASTELTIADRRLNDVGAHLSQQGAASPEALAALLRGDEAAAHHADTLGSGERDLIAEHVAGHVQRLDALARSATDPGAIERLNEAAERARSIVARLRTTPVRPGPNLVRTLTPTQTAAVVVPATTATPLPVSPVTVRPRRTVTPSATTSPLARPRPSRTPSPRPVSSATPVPPGPIVPTRPGVPPGPAPLPTVSVTPPLAPTVTVIVPPLPTVSVTPWPTVTPRARPTLSITPGMWPSVTPPVVPKVTWTPPATPPGGWPTVLPTPWSTLPPTTSPIVTVSPWTMPTVTVSPVPSPTWTRPVLPSPTNSPRPTVTATPRPTATRAPTATSVPTWPAGIAATPPVPTSTVTPRGGRLATITATVSVEPRPTRLVVTPTGTITVPVPPHRPTATPAAVSPAAAAGQTLALPRRQR